VPLTERAERTNKAPLGTMLGRWLSSLVPDEPQAKPVAHHLASAPIIMAAVDLSPGQEELADHIRLIVRRILAIEPKARLACVTVRRTPRIAVDFGEDEQGRSLHVRGLVALKNWARRLEVPGDRITYTVLEAPDPAAALLDYARSAHVDHIVIGARGSSAMRRYLGSVSAQVVAEAPCNVTVVRMRAPGEAPWNEEGDDARAPRTSPLSPQGGSLSPSTGRGSPAAGIGGRPGAERANAPPRRAPPRRGSPP
jgi:nucleotide-binding universal stress UspA family protein